MRCHEAIVGAFHFGPRSPLSREELLAPEVPEERVAAYQHLAEVKTLLRPVFEGKDTALLQRHLRDWSAQEIEASIRSAFDDADSRITLDVLAASLGEAQIGLVRRCLEKRQPHTPEVLAQTLHRLQRAAIRDAFELRDGE